MCLSIEVKHPELVLGKGIHAGFEWVVVHNQLGYRCGYVRVPKGHPWYGKDYDAIEAIVHGGLTFTESDMPCAKGGADDGWWVGFDCGHYGDAIDPSLPTLDDWHDLKKHPALTGGTIRTQQYVEEQCRQLCEQAEVDARLR